MIRRRWWFACLFVGPLAAAAETMYVTDQLTVGVRADASPDAAVLRTVATGTALEVSERIGSLAKVRTPDGIEGWVDSAALSAQPPASEVLKSVRADLERTRGQLTATQAQLEKARAAPAAPVVSPELAKLKTELAAARSELTEAQTALRQRDQELADIKATPLPAMEPPPVPAPEPEAEPTESPAFGWLGVGIAFAMLLIGFIGGIVWVKESIRRRMGGLYLRV